MFLGKPIANRLANKINQKQELTKKIAASAVVLLGSEPNKNKPETIAAAINHCHEFVEAVEKLYPTIAHQDKILLRLCYTALGKYYSCKGEYQKARPYLLETCKKSFDLMNDEYDAALLDSIINFSAVNLHLARYIKDAPSAAYNQQVNDMVGKGLPYVVKWQQPTKEIQFYVLLSIAYDGLNNFKQCIVFIDKIYALGKADGYQALKTCSLLEFVVAMHRASNYFLSKGKYAQVIKLAGFLTQVVNIYHSILLEDKHIPPILHRIEFECSLLQAGAYLGQADLINAKQAYADALSLHILIYRLEQATDNYKIIYPYSLLFERLISTIYHLDGLAAYLARQKQSLTAANRETVFAGFFETYAPHLIKPVELKQNNLCQLAEEMDGYSFLMRDWPGLVELKKDFYQRALEINKQLANQAQIEYYEKLLLAVTNNSTSQAISKLTLDLSAIKTAQNPSSANQAPKTAQENSVPRKVSQSRRQKLTPGELKNYYHQTTLLKAYELYQQKHYLEAIEYYKQVQGRFSPRNKLLAMQCLSGIGDCYSAMAKALTRAPGQRAETAELRGQALQAYHDALKLTADEPGQLSAKEYQEIQRLADLIYPSIDAINREIQKTIDFERAPKSQSSLLISSQALESRIIHKKAGLPKKQAHTAAAIKLKPRAPQEKLALPSANAKSTVAGDMLHNNQQTMLLQAQGPQVFNCKLKVSKGSQTVIDTLQQEGFKAYLVGGAVRDQLLGLTPTDYDVVTNAKPEQVAALFPGNSKIVGQRFALVLIKFEQETIEVTTLRKPKSMPHLASAWQDKQPEITYGFSLREDAFERDFTINALYYCLEGNILDHVGGYQHLKNKLLCLLGAAEQRFQKDPIIMLRALRLAAKLDFTLDESIEKALPLQAILLTQCVNPERLHREIAKTFLQPQAKAILSLALKTGLLAVLFPAAAAYLHQQSSSAEQQQFANRLIAISKRYRPEQIAGQVLLFACMLWLPLQQALNEADTIAAIDRVLAEQQKSFTLAEKFAGRIKAVWLIHIGNQKTLSSISDAHLQPGDFIVQQIFADLLADHSPSKPLGTSFASI